MIRATDRNRRFARLRTTALPTFLEQVYPIRISEPEPGFLGKACRISPFRSALCPRLTA